MRRVTSMKAMTFMIAIWIVLLLLLAREVYKSAVIVSVPTNMTFKTLEDFMSGK